MDGRKEPALQTALNTTVQTAPNLERIFPPLFLDFEPIKTIYYEKYRNEPAVRNIAVQSWIKETVKIDVTDQSKEMKGNRKNRVRQI